jgi:hypothetical protein
MTRQLPFLAALFLLCPIILQAHAAPLFNYRSGLIDEPGHATVLSGPMGWNVPAYKAAASPSRMLSPYSIDPVESPPAPAADPCSELYNDGFETSFGTWIDGGSNCARSNSFPNSGSWSVELRAGVGITSSMFTPALNLTGVGVNLSFSFYPQGYENGEGLVLEYATDANGTYTGFAAWVRGTHFENNTRQNVSVPMNSVAWTSTSRLRLRSVASATDDRVYIDDVVISNCCEIGAPCNDNDQCTTGDVINSNCQCAGTWQDADGDGTCDAFDICPGEDDYLMISEAPCDDGDPCTVNDHMDADICGCEGQYIDWDQDGYCITDDPNDTDACIPDANNPACNPCTTHSNAHFESNFQIWNSGGNDCSRLYAPQYANAGNYCVRIRDNSGTSSSMFTDNIDLAGLDNVSISFSFIAVGLEVNEDFILEVSTNGGSSYTPYESWSRGTDFQNNSRQYVFLPVNGFTWSSLSRFRIRCDASANDDAVYIDDVVIRSCLNFAQMQDAVDIIQPAISNERPVYHFSPEDVVLRPNPVATELQLSGMKLEGTTIDIFNATGSMMRYERLSENSLDVSQLLPGLYFVRIEKEGQLIVRRFIKD